ncbi:hypothetical protein, partial [Achromobacter denitrificans]|uniref:hypothetical protein n=1 Tax=Achromobacter denitrificans TaxID=32002 RepID=UPI001E29C512
SARIAARLSDGEAGKDRMGRAVWRGDSMVMRRPGDSRFSTFYTKYSFKLYEQDESPSRGFEPEVGRYFSAKCL